MEILYNEFKFVDAFAVSSILVIIAIIILIIRNIVEYKAKRDGEIVYVELKNINKKFGSYKASNNVSFRIEKGKLIGLLGPSGSGKTTILRMIAGLEKPDNGEIFIDGVRVNDINRLIREELAFRIKGLEKDIQVNYLEVKGKELLLQEL